MIPGRAAAAALLVLTLLAGCAPAPPPGSSTAPAASAAPAVPATPAASAPASPAPLTSHPAPTPSLPPRAALPRILYDPRLPPEPSPTPTPTPSPGPASGRAGPPTRVAIPSLGIDLPVVAPPRNSTWPLCDVAEFFRPPAFQHPGEGGVTYIYAHAQEGMFLPILLASRRSGGRAMIGDWVTVWTANNHRYSYRISSVRRFQKSLDWAFALPPNSLVLQTSENQYRTGTKVMLVARQVGGPVQATTAEAQPPAKPRVCGR